MIKVNANAFRIFIPLPVFESKVIKYMLNKASAKKSRKRCARKINWYLQIRGSIFLFIKNNVNISNTLKLTERRKQDRQLLENMIYRCQ